MEHEQRPHGWARTEDPLGYASPSFNYQDQGMDTMRPGGGELGQTTAPTVVPELGGYERPSPLASMPMVELQAQAGPRMNDAEAQYELARRLENAPGHGPLSMVEKNVPRALHWYEKAAEQQHPEAQSAALRLRKNYWKLRWCTLPQLGPILAFCFAAIFCAVTFSILNAKDPVARGATSNGNMTLTSPSSSA